WGTLPTLPCGYGERTAGHAVERGAAELIPTLVQMNGYISFKEGLLIIMRFTPITIISLVAAALGSPLINRQERLRGGVFYCTEPNFTGVCVQTPPIEWVQFIPLCKQFFTSSA
ncbi:unnamed protein product, partial [Rhizoctonia solani]